VNLSAFHHFEDRVPFPRLCGFSLSHPSENPQTFVPQTFFSDVYLGNGRVNRAVSISITRVSFHLICFPTWLLIVPSRPLLQAIRRGCFCRPVSHRQAGIGAHCRPRPRPPKFGQGFRSFRLFAGVFLLFSAQPHRTHSSTEVFPRVPFGRLVFVSPPPSPPSPPPLVSASSFILYSDTSHVPLQGRFGLTFTVRCPVTSCPFFFRVAIPPGIATRFPCGPSLVLLRLVPRSSTFLDSPPTPSEAPVHEFSCDCWGHVFFFSYSREKPLPCHNHQRLSLFRSNFLLNWPFRSLRSH